MLQPFFTAAMQAPGRHLTFRRTVALHVLILTALAWAASLAQSLATITAIAHFTLILGFVEGGALIGWRLTQLPKSQALEFLLVSSLQPRRVFLAEAVVGILRFALVSLSGLPILLGLVLSGTVEPADLWVLAFMPFTWGIVAGLGLTAFAYEPARVRKLGEFVGLFGVLIYLVIGVLAGENLKLWLAKLPPEWADFIFRVVLTIHHSNPFGVVRNWFDAAGLTALVWRQFLELEVIAGVLIFGFGIRAAGRLKGHFHDRHYRPIWSGREDQSALIGDRPLSWWAVRRVMEYSGRVNVWLAGGYSIVYAVYIVAGDNWPPWMGRVVFQIFDGWGGAPMVATAMCVMAAVPAAFQFGLWDPSPSDRCKRLELLLLTDLEGKDYWQASLAAAWKRGRGYLIIASVLWLALAIAGRVAWYDSLAAAFGGVALWAFSFAVGFRAFCSGRQASGIALLLTLGMPLLLFVLLRAGFNTLAAFVPTAACYLPLKTGLTASWVAGFDMLLAATWWLTRSGLMKCEPELRQWLSDNQGRRTE